MAEAKPSTDQIAMELAKLLEADLGATLAIMSGMLQSIRENAKPEEIAAVRFGSRCAPD